MIVRNGKTTVSFGMIIHSAVITDRIWDGVVRLQSKNNRVYSRKSFFFPAPELK